MKNSYYPLITLLLLVLSADADYGDTGEYDTHVLKGLPDELVEHLVHSDDSTLAEFGREIGFYQLTNINLVLENRLCGLSFQHDQEKMISLLHYIKRIATVLACDYHYEGNLNNCLFLEQHSLSTILEIVTLRKKLGYLYDDPGLDITTKLKKTYASLREFERYNDQLGIAKAHSQLAALYGDMGESGTQLEFLKKTALRSEKNGYITSACQSLAIIGLLHKKAGAIDSMLFYYDKVKKLAHRSRIPIQAARILIFYSSYYKQIGRYAITHDLLNEAIAVCREFKGGFSEIRFVIDAMRFYADLECWRVVESLSNRAEIILHRSKDEEMRAAVTQLYLTRKNLMDARILMSRSDVVKAEQIFNAIHDTVRDLPFITEYAELLLFWSIGLFRNGEYDAALNRIHAGQQYLEKQPLPDYAGHFLILLAKIELLRGELENAEETLGEFEHYASTFSGDLRIEWVEYYATLGSIQLQREEEDQALHTLEKGLGYLEKEISIMDASVHAYLWLDKCAPLRTLMHDLVSNDPALGYGAELYWRDLYRMLGSEKRADGQTAESVSLDPHLQLVNTQAEVPIIERFRDKYLTARRCLTGRDAVHCLYLVHDDKIWRWTVSDIGIRRDILDCPAQKGSRLVLEARKRLAATENRSDNTLEPDLADNLGLLARTLLPHEIINDDTVRDFRLFLVTADGFLGGIPFEAFDVGLDGTYTPLLSRIDIAYTRYICCRPTKYDPAPGIILANTHASKEFRNRYLFQPSLSEVSIEAETAAALDGEELLLSGPAATKRRLMDIWEDAPYLYVASHIISDPEIPYLVHVPMAEDTTRIGIETTYLDVTDIRSADLGRCGLVVLSGCSSGVPYVETRTEGPSLGDAFLDAGAGAVIQTFWDVRDDTARELMTSFVRLTSGTRVSPIHALCETRRRAMHGPDGIRHPAVWASYAVELGRLPAD